MVKAQVALIVERNVYASLALTINCECDRMAAGGESRGVQQLGRQRRIDTALDQRLLVERGQQRSTAGIFGAGIEHHQRVGHQQHHAGAQRRQSRTSVGTPESRHGFATTVFQYSVHGVHLG
ncbi:hypothetical protein D3C79_959800 [compost metagenome]